MLGESPIAVTSSQASAMHVSCAINGGRAECFVIEGLCIVIKEQIRGVKVP